MNRATPKASAMTALPNPLADLVHLVDRAFELAGRFPMPLLVLLFRIAMAVVFFRSGLVKLASWDSTLALFTNEYHVPVLPPELAATMAATIELTAPVLLVLGFGARFGAAAMLGMTLVIQVFVYPENWPEHLTWACLLGTIITQGAGPLSLDHLIRRALHR